MISTRYIKRIEKETEKRLKKHLRTDMYFCIENLTVNFTDCKEIIIINARAGYPTDDDKYCQIRFDFEPSVDMFKNAGEFAVVLVHYIASRLDDFEIFREVI